MIELVQVVVGRHTLRVRVSRPGPPPCCEIDVDAARWFVEHVTVSELRQLFRAAEACLELWERFAP